MHPILFSFGPLHVYSFGFMAALGVLVCLFLMTRAAKRFGFPKPQDVSDLVFVTVASGFFGGRLAYVFENFRGYLGHPLRIFAVWEGGLIFYGGVIGALLGLLLFMRLKKIPYFAGLDFLLPYTALTHAFGRIGCFLNGCCYGRRCDLPWAVRFPETGRVHPTQLYEAAFNMALFVFLRNRYARRNFDGEVSGYYFMIYAAGRFVIEFFRAGNPGWGALTVNQWTSFLIFGFGALIYAVNRKRTSKEVSG